MFFLDTTQNWRWHKVTFTLDFLERKSRSYTIISTNGSDTNKLATAKLDVLLLITKHHPTAATDIRNSVSTNAKNFTTSFWNPTMKYAILEKNRMGIKRNGMISNNTFEMKKDEQR